MPCHVAVGRCRLTADQPVLGQAPNGLRNLRLDQMGDGLEAIVSAVPQRPCSVVSEPERPFEHR